MLGPVRRDQLLDRHYPTQNGRQQAQRHAQSDLKDVYDYIGGLQGYADLFRLNFHNVLPWLDSGNGENRVLMNKLANHKSFQDDFDAMSPPVMNWEGIPVNGKTVDVTAKLENAPLGQLIYLTEVYMYYHGPNNNPLANIHDGWALARMLMLNADAGRNELVDFKVPMNTPEVICDVSELTDEEASLLMHNQPIRGASRTSNIQLNLGMFSCRGDQLRMFVRFDLLDENVKGQDKPFSDFISAHEAHYRPYADQLHELLNVSQQTPGQVGGRRRSKAAEAHSAKKHYVVVGSNGLESGRYSSSCGPAAAAKKAASRRFTDKVTRLEITVRETGTDRTFTYTARRVKLARPVVRRVAGGREIRSEYVTEVKAKRR